MIGRLIRNFMLKISTMEPERAQRIKMYWAILYGFVGWNVFTLVLYSAGKAGENLTREERMAYYRRITGEEGKINIYRVQGVSSATTEEVILKEEVGAPNGDGAEEEKPKREPRITQGIKLPDLNLIRMPEVKPPTEASSSDDFSSED